MDSEKTTSKNARISSNNPKGNDRNHKHGDEMALTIYRPINLPSRFREETDRRNLLPPNSDLKTDIMQNNKSYGLHKK